MGELVHGSANISACLLSITTQRLDVVSFVTPFMSTGTSVLTGMPDAHVSEWLWIKPFSGAVWAILLMVVIVTCTAVWVVDWCSPYGSRIKGVSLEDKRQWNLPNTYYRTIQAMLEREVPGPGAWSSRFSMLGSLPSTSLQWFRARATFCSHDGCILHIRLLPSCIRIGTHEL
jgi:hypothetical protein